MMNRIDGGSQSASATAGKFIKNFLIKVKLFIEYLFVSDLWSLLPHLPLPDKRPKHIARRKLVYKHVLRSIKFYRIFVWLECVFLWFDDFFYLIVESIQVEEFISVLVRCFLVRSYSVARRSLRTERYSCYGKWMADEANDKDSFGSRRKFILAKKCWRTWEKEE